MKLACCDAADDVFPHGLSFCLSIKPHEIGKRRRVLLVASMCGPLLTLLIISVFYLIGQSSAHMGTGTALMTAVFFCFVCWFCLAA
jgi:hypothetical protein